MAHKKYKRDIFYVDGSRDTYSTDRELMQSDGLLQVDDGVYVNILEIKKVVTKVVTVERKK